MNNLCPVCGNSETVSTILRDDAITTQNYIYTDFDKAVGAATGKFNLCFCRRCGLAFNADFDARLMKYDAGYTAYIPSEIFADYYKEIADFLHEKFSLEDKLTIDIACGKGTFLKLLCETYPKILGLGIDPSYEADDPLDSAENPRFIQDVFREKYIEENPALIVCRHAFEQIENPLAFLKSIRRALKDYEETEFFIEVGDFERMIENESFADFCYERCSFFTAEALKNTLRLAGFTVEKIQKAFGGQYLWAFGTIRQDAAEFSPKDLDGEDKFAAVGERLSAYSRNETRLISDMKIKLRELKAAGNVIAIWGMATKGVVFCNLIDSERRLLNYCIDINPQKQRGFVPRSGHRINAPDALVEVGGAVKITVVVMNPNYLPEIADYCRRLNLNAEFIDAGGKLLSAG